MSHYEAKIVDIPGHGHCLFLALFHQKFHHIPDSHAELVPMLRGQVVDYILDRINGGDHRWYDCIEKNLKNLGEIDGLCPSAEGLQTVSDYLSALRRDLWGGCETIQAVANMEQASIHVHREKQETDMIFQPEAGAPLHVWHLAYRYSELLGKWTHYDSVILG